MENDDVALLIDLQIWRFRNDHRWFLRPRPAPTPWNGQYCSVGKQENPSDYLLCFLENSFRDTPSTLSCCTVLLWISTEIRLTIQNCRGETHCQWKSKENAHHATRSADKMGTSFVCRHSYVGLVQKPTTMTSRGFHFDTLGKSLFSENGPLVEK